MHRLIESLLTGTCKSNMDESHKWLDSGALHRFSAKGSIRRPLQHALRAERTNVYIPTLNDFLFTHSTDEHLYMHTSLSLMVVCYMYVDVQKNESRVLQKEEQAKYITYYIFMLCACIHGLMLTCTNTVKIVRAKMAVTCCSLRRHSFGVASWPLPSISSVKRSSASEKATAPLRPL